MLWGRGGIGQIHARTRTRNGQRAQRASIRKTKSMATRNTVVGWYVHALCSVFVSVEVLLNVLYVYICACVYIVHVRIHMYACKFMLCSEMYCYATYVICVFMNVRRRGLLA